MLCPYKNEPFIPGNKVGRVYVYTADGVSSTYTRPTPLEMFPIVQVQNNQFKQSAGDLVKTPTGFVLSGVPSEGAQVISIATIRFVFRAYDQVTIPNNEDPNVCITPIFLVDPEHIASVQYEKSADQDAIVLNFIDFDTDFGGLAEWLQFGKADPETGEPSGVWLDPGEPLELQDITWNSELSSSADALDNVIFVEDASDLIADDTTIFLNIDKGTVNEDHVQVESVNTGTGEISLVTPLSFHHAADAKVYLMGVKAYGMLTLPIPANGPTNYVDIGLNAVFDEISRLG